MDTRRILFARFRLKHESLREFKVFVLDFPFWAAIDDFLSVIAQSPDRIAAKKKDDDYLFQNSEFPPFRRLNKALNLNFSGLVQGFETYDGQYKGANKWFDNRRLVSYALQAPEAEQQIPSTDRLLYIIEEWLSEWIETCFEIGRFGNELVLNGNAGQKAYEALIAIVQNTVINWEEINAAELWQKQEAKQTQPLHRLAYNALPSLLAALFIEKSQGHILTLEGLKEDKNISEWWLSQDGKDSRHLVVVTAPITMTKDRKWGKFSYLLEFVVQTQGASNEPWIAVYIRIRRWGTKQLRKKNAERDISVYLRSHSEWVEGWPFSKTLVQLPLTGSYFIKDKKVNSKLEWLDNPSSLIERIRGGKGKGLAKPDDIVSDPQAYQNGAVDEYYILHAEGMDYEGVGRGHPVNTGLALKERGQFMSFIIKILAQYLIPDTPMDVDPLATLQVTTVKGNTWASIRGNRIQAMFTHEDLEKVSLLPRGASEEEKLLKRMQVTIEALMRASGNRKIRILVFYRDEGGKFVLPHYLRKLLFLNENTELPVTIELVEPVPIIPTQLGDVPAKTYKQKTSKNEQKRFVQREWREKRDAWETFLKPYYEEGACHLAFVEMDKVEDDDTSAWLKEAIRNAAYNVGINTQMINRINPEALQKTNQYKGDLSRAKNASFDLLLRQTALNYGTPQEIYQLAGLSEEAAKSLVVIGMYRFVSNNPKVDYPLAVVSLPDGETWVILPDEEGNICEPIRYIDAGIEIGRIFASADKKKRLYNYYNEEKPKPNGYRLKNFAEQVLLKANSLNALCLVLMEAEWRKWGLLPISNEKIKYNELAIGNSVFSPKDLPNLRLIRMRDSGTLNETPQYVELREGETWEDSHNADEPDVMTGVVDIHCQSNLLHYFSIGRQPDAIDDHSKGLEKELYEEGLEVGWNELMTFDANEAHKHQQAIEFVPFFMQDADDEMAYCRIAHFLRYSPAWNGGNLVLPYPLHLAKKLLDDVMDVFEPRL